VQAVDDFAFAGTPAVPQEIGSRMSDDITNNRNAAGKGGKGAAGRRD
jgi:hypothetical protein